MLTGNLPFWRLTAASGIVTAAQSGSIQLANGNGRDKAAPFVLLEVKKPPEYGSNHSVRRSIWLTRWWWWWGGVGGGADSLQWNSSIWHAAALADKIRCVPPSAGYRYDPAHLHPHELRQAVKAQRHSFSVCEFKKKKRWEWEKTVHLVPKNILLGKKEKANRQASNSVFTLWQPLKMQQKKNQPD